MRQDAGHSTLWSRSRFLFFWHLPLLFPTIFVYWETAGAAPTTIRLAHEYISLLSLWKIVSLFLFISYRVRYYMFAFFWILLKAFRKKSIISLLHIGMNRYYFYEEKTRLYPNWTDYRDCDPCNSRGNPDSKCNRIYQYVAKDSMRQ